MPWLLPKLGRDQLKGDEEAAAAHWGSWDGASRVRAGPGFWGAAWKPRGGLRELPEQRGRQGAAGARPAAECGGKGGEEAEDGARWFWPFLTLPLSSSPPRLSVFVFPACRQGLRGRTGLCALLNPFKLAFVNKRCDFAPKVHFLPLQASQAALSPADADWLCGGAASCNFGHQLCPVGDRAFLPLLSCVWPSSCSVQLWYTRTMHT